MRFEKHLAIYLILLLLASTVLGQGSLIPLGPPGPTMKSLQEVEPRTAIGILPAEIQSGGSYYVTRNLLSVAGTNGISILANDVTLDLNGFTLLGRTNANHGIYVGRCTNITVMNGIIRGWGGDGIYADNAVNCRLTGLTVMTNQSEGLRVGDHAIISDCLIKDNAAAGLYTEDAAVVTRVTSSRNGVYGIRVDRNGVVANCVATYNGADGIFAYWDSTVTDCTANMNQQNGIEVDGSIVKGCVVNHNTLSGIRLYADSYASGNSCDGNDEAGIRGASGNRVENNHATDGGYGFYATGSGLFIKNTASGNLTNYNLAVSTFGPVVREVGKMTNSNPWANIDY